MKLIASSILLALLCGPALADSKTLQLGFTLKNGKDTRNYAIKVVADECASISSKAPEQQDEIRVCAHPDGATEIRLQLDWMTRQGDRELRNKSVVIATRGQKFDLDGGAAVLAVTIQ